MLTWTQAKKCPMKLHLIYKTDALQLPDCEFPRSIRKFR